MGFFSAVFDGNEEVEDVLSSLKEGQQREA